MLQQAFRGGGFGGGGFGGGGGGAQAGGSSGNGGSGTVIIWYPEVSCNYPAPQASSSVSWSFTETRTNGTFTVIDNSTTIATLTANGSGNSQISQSNVITATLAPVNYPSSGSVTMSLNVDGGTTISVTGSANTTISASFAVGRGLIYNITGSIEWNSRPTGSIDYLIVIISCFIAEEFLKKNYK
jgi:hypothetical protein